MQKTFISTNITAPNVYLDQPCVRCGSKKRIAKTWKEKVPTFSGSTLVEYSQIICTNKACQKLFDENLEKDNKKREAVRVEKEEREKIRKTNSLLQAKKNSKSKTK